MTRQGSWFVATRPWTRRVVYAAFAVGGAAYLGWRFAFTLSDAHPAWSAAFFAAEVWVWLAGLVFYGLLGPPGARTSEPPEPLGRHEVDVLIATCGEDLDLLRTTATAARDLDGPHRTWLCDDADRPEVKALAEAIGVGYLARGVRTDFKAGNQNHALARTTGDLLLFLDADHVVRRTLLTRLVPWFRDVDLAFVQIPQVYYNLDSFQHVDVERTGVLWHEGALFQHRTQGGATPLGGPLFVGTGALVRRLALDAIGGIATGTITEDAHTSMRLHAAGWRSVFVDEALGVLLAPETPYAYARQRLRWAQGALQILRLDNPLLRRGLGLGQRIAYFATWMGFLAAWPSLVLYLAPALYLLAGLAPVEVDPDVGVPVIAAHVALDLAVFRLLAAPEGRFLYGERFRLTSLAVHLVATGRLLWPRGAVFRVTPKGPQRGLPAWVWLPTAALWALHAAAVGAGLLALGAPGAHPWAVALCVALCAHYATIGAFALGDMFRHRASDEPFTVPVALDAPIEGAPGEAVRVERIGSTLAWCAGSGPAIGTQVVLRLPIGAVPGVVEASTGARFRVRFDPPGRWRDPLDSWLYGVAVPAYLAGHSGSPPMPSADVR